MRAERAEQFGAAIAAPHPAAPAARAHGYGESVEVLVADHAPLVRKIAWQVFSRIARTSELDDLIQTGLRSEEHTSELQSLMRISYAVFCLNTKKLKTTQQK